MQRLPCAPGRYRTRRRDVIPDCEPYRRLAGFMLHRLRTALSEPDHPDAYPDAAAFAADLQLIRTSLAAGGGSGWPDPDRPTAAAGGDLRLPPPHPRHPPARPGPRPGGARAGAGCAACDALRPCRSAFSRNGELLDTLRAIADLKRAIPPALSGATSSAVQPVVRIPLAHLADGAVRGACRPRGRRPRGDAGAALRIDRGPAQCPGDLPDPLDLGRLPAVSRLLGATPGGHARLLRLQQGRRHAHQLVGDLQGPPRAAPGRRRVRREAPASSTVAAARSGGAAAPPTVRSWPSRQGPSPAPSRSPSRGR